MSEIRISAVIPAFDSGKYIARAIESVLNQSFKPEEIIVVDDGSTDNTKDQVHAFSEKVNYIYQPNAGASAARNTGVLAAKYEWIAFLDADDYWLEDRLFEQVRILKRNNLLNWAASNYFTCLCENSRKAAYTDQKKFSKLLKGKDYISYFDAVVLGISGWTGTMLIKRKTLIDAGLFRVGQKQANDLDMWWRIACRSPNIGLSAKPAAVYHLQIKNSITSSKFSAEVYIDLISRHLKIADEFGCRINFEKMASFKLQGWIRSMLFDSTRASEVRQLLQNFNQILPIWYKIIIHIALLSPKFTEKSLLLVSKISRKFNLRRRLVAPPQSRV